MTRVLNHRQKLLQNKFMQNKKRPSKSEPLTKLKGMSHFMMKELVKSLNAVYETLAIPPLRCNEILSMQDMFVVIVNKNIF